MVKAYEEDELRLCCNCRQRKFSPTAVTSLSVIIFSFLLALFVFISPGWAWTLEIRNTKDFQAAVYGHYGLWYICWNLVEWEDPGEHDCDLMSDLGYIPGWLKGLQAIAVFMMLSGLAALLLNCVYICLKKANENRLVIKLIIGTCFLTAFFAVPLFIVFSVMFLHDSYWCCDGAPVEIVRRQLDYAFVVECCVGPFFCVGGGIAWLEYRRLKRMHAAADYQRKVQAQTERRRQQIRRANEQDGFLTD